MPAALFSQPLFVGCALLSSLGFVLGSLSSLSLSLSLLPRFSPVSPPGISAGERSLEGRGARRRKKATEKQN